MGEHKAKKKTGPKPRLHGPEAEAARAAARARYQRRRVKWLAYLKRWRAENPDKVEKILEKNRRYFRAWYAENREALLKRRRQRAA